VAPLSVAAATIFDVWISVKPRACSVPRKPASAAAAMRT
jgi:hypothetical protein